MNAAATDSLLQTCLVGFVLNFATALMMVYLWRDNRAERWLIYMSAAKTIGAARWILHYVAEGEHAWRLPEGILIQLTMLAALISCYDLSTYKPWRMAPFAWTVCALLTVCTVAASFAHMQTQAGYLIYAATAVFCAVVMWQSYKRTGLSGYAFVCAVFVYQVIVIVFGLLAFGEGIANIIVVPVVFQLAMMMSFVVTFYQRNRRTLQEHQRTLEKIFETAPSALAIVRPKGGIEKINSVALDLFGMSEAQMLGKTLVETNVIDHSPERDQMYLALRAGQRVIGSEFIIRRAGREPRLVSVSATPVGLEHGERYVFAIYDLTEQRRAADQLRASAEEIRELYLRLASAEDDERRALHRELHDQIGANLSALLLELELLGRIKDADVAARHLANAMEVSKETALMARDLMAQLRPPALDDYGLVAALKVFAEAQCKRFDIDVQMEGEDLSPRLASIVEAALFRIAQEAVVNAIKHASAALICISVAETEGRITLAIEDDGVGFDPQAPVPGAHWGMKNMAERASGVLAEFRVESARDQGTRIVVELDRMASSKA